MKSMEKKKLIIITLLFITGCNNLKFNRYVGINDIFEISDDSYYVFFSSNYCGDCNEISKEIDFFINIDAINLYELDLDLLSSDEFYQMNIVYSPYYDTYHDYLEVSKLEDLVFYTAPCIYYFKSVDNKSILKDIYYDQSRINQLFEVWREVYGR